MGITMGKISKIDFWSFHELGARQSGLVCTPELVFDSSFQGYPTLERSENTLFWKFQKAHMVYGPRHNTDFRTIDEIIIG